MLGQRRGGRFLMVPGFHLHPPGMHRCTCIAIPRPSGPAAFERQVPLSHHCRQPCVSKVQISMFGMLFVPTFPTCLAFFLHSPSSSVKFVTSQKCVTMPCCLPCLALTWTLIATLLASHLPNGFIVVHSWGTLLHFHPQKGVASYLPSHLPQPFHALLPGHSMRGAAPTSNVRSHPCLSPTMPSCVLSAASAAAAFVYNIGEHATWPFIFRGCNPCCLRKG